jgi:hypothetical protein
MVSLGCHLTLLTVLCGLDTFKYAALISFHCTNFSVQQLQMADVKIWAAYDIIICNHILVTSYNLWGITLATTLKWLWVKPGPRTTDQISASDWLAQMAGVWL